MKILSRAVSSVFVLALPLAAHAQSAEPLPQVPLQAVPGGLGMLVFGATFSGLGENNTRGRLSAGGGPAKELIDIGAEVIAPDETLGTAIYTGVFW
ncbi:hypothetical protein [Litorisediminicola beolgyonensis]|uniref:Uncharacterized protein n=1 Tax=Litorisediminicola beolgyonensis TaxID=1173614 RepID=A0ABW3ZHC3_9RHOB